MVGLEAQRLGGCYRKKEVRNDPSEYPIPFVIYNKFGASKMEGKGGGVQTEHVHWYYAYDRPPGANPRFFTKGVPYAEDHSEPLSCDSNRPPWGPVASWGERGGEYEVWEANVCCLRPFLTDGWFPVTGYGPGEGLGIPRPTIDTHKPRRPDHREAISTQPQPQPGTGFFSFLSLGLEYSYVAR